MRYFICFFIISLWIQFYAYHMSIFQYSLVICGYWLPHWTVQLYTIHIFSYILLIFLNSYMHFFHVSNQLLEFLHSFPLNYCVQMHVTYAPCILRYIIYIYPYDWYDPYKWPTIFKINLIIFCCVMILTLVHSSIGHLSNLPFFSVTVMSDFFLEWNFPPFLSLSFSPCSMSFSGLKKVRLRDRPSSAGPGSTTSPLYKHYLGASMSSAIKLVTNLTGPINSWMCKEETKMVGSEAWRV